MSRIVLNRELVLEAATRLSDGAGGYTQSWTPLGTLWGEVRPRTGRLTAAGDAGAVSVAGFQVIVRAAPVGQSNRPVPGQRFRMGSRAFLIEAVTEAEPDIRHLLCQCREEVVS